MKCSYCSPHFHKGNNAFPDLEKASAFIDRLSEIRRGSNRGTKISFVGGEPTEYEPLPDLCRHILNSLSARVHVMSNSAADLSVWRRLAPVIHTAALSFHEGKVSQDHYKAVCELLRGSGVSVSCVFPMWPASFDRSLVLADEMKSKGFSVSLQPLYVDHTSRRRLFDYTDDQIAILFPKQMFNSDILVENTNGAEQTTADHLIHHKMNSFTGMKCGIGIDQLTIDQAGNIRGGWCGVGGIIGNVSAGWFEPPKEAITCTKATCSNPLDLSVPKWTDDE